MRAPATRGTLTRCASKEAEPLSHARMVLRFFRKIVFLAGLAAEAQAPMMMGDKTESSSHFAQQFANVLIGCTSDFELPTS